MYRPKRKRHEGEKHDKRRQEEYDTQGETDKRTKWQTEGQKTTRKGTIKNKQRPAERSQEPATREGETSWASRDYTVQLVLAAELPLRLRLRLWLRHHLLCRHHLAINSAEEAVEDVRNVLAGEGRALHKRAVQLRGQVLSSLVAHLPVVLQIDLVADEDARDRVAPWDSHEPTANARRHAKQGDTEHEKGGVYPQEQLSVPPWYSPAWPSLTTLSRNAYPQTHVGCQERNTKRQE